MSFQVYKSLHSISAIVYTFKHISTWQLTSRYISRLFVNFLYFWYIYIYIYTEYYCKKHIITWTIVRIKRWVPKSISIKFDLSCVNRWMKFSKRNRDCQKTRLLPIPWQPQLVWWQLVRMCHQQSHPLRSHLTKVLHKTMTKAEVFPWVFVPFW